MINKFKSWQVAWCFYLAVTSFACSNIDSTVLKLTLEGNTAYHVYPGKINHVPVIFSATYHGKVFCHTQKGELLWSAEAGEGFPFDLQSADIDLDGNDELLLASSDGGLYAFDESGEVLWVFKREAPLYQIETLIIRDTVYILTGGIERILFSLDARGKVLNSYISDGVIRLLKFGKILNDNEFQVAVGTAKSALSGNFSINLLYLPNLEPIWVKDVEMEGAQNQSRYFSMVVFDINKDGNDEIVLGHEIRHPDKMTIVDKNGNYKIQEFSQSPPMKLFKMNLLSHIYSTTLNDEYIINHFGDKLIISNLDGNVRNILDCPYSLTNSAFDSSTNTLFFSSELSGGDGIYGFKLDRPDWQVQFTNLKAIGKINQIEENMALLNKQVLEFTPLEYQPEVKNTMVSVSEKANKIEENYLATKLYDKVEFTQYIALSENYDRSFLSMGFDKKKDWRRDYNLTYNEIVQIAKDLEMKKQNFIVWAGHGTDPFFMRLETMEGILKHAPKTFRGFVFAELEHVDETMAYVVKSHIKPLAELCLLYGNKKIFLRNKNIFWNGSLYLDFWQEILRNERYREIIVPSMEQTNARTQSLSLYARMGLWLTGTFESFADRPVTDNSNFTRLWEWTTTENLNHFIRAATISRSLGANFFLVQVDSEINTDMIPFYLMMEKGIIPLPNPEDLVSVPDIAIGISIPPDPDYLKHGINGHKINLYQKENTTYVFDRLDCFWGGAIVPEWDFTNYAFNCKRRMTNFIPQAPYGNIAVLPSDTDLSKHTHFKKLLITDGKNWIDENGKSHSPENYKNFVISELEKSASQLPIRVFGEVSWSAIKLDSSHYRVILVDPGYLDPSDRSVVMSINNLGEVSARDILSNDNLPVIENKIYLTIPMGILRVIDLTLVNQ
jgi:lambda-carrageenase